jgi:hypothetical protein
LFPDLLLFANRDSLPNAIRAEARCPISVSVPADGEALALMGGL